MVTLTTMLAHLFHSTVSALCHEIAREHAASHDDGAGELVAPYNDVTRFVIRQHAKMQGILGYAIQVTTLLFALSSVASHGVLFHHLAPKRRRIQVAAWSVSRLGPCRDLIRFYSSLVILALYSRPIPPMGKTSPG